ncbi:MAG: DegT/DnrJ/EryC1/StrS family aminotransferase [Ardenticatenaceae bacterium]|nr:DegT/DnrJ/EryC1/StrS family aminotransferase [Ardenticatenaceae bacterium]
MKPLTKASEIFAAVRVLAEGGLSRYHTSGVSEVEKFEEELQEFIGVRHALAVNSGTSALICALVGAGVGPGDEVLVPAYTWVATAAAPLAVGAIPVLVEVDDSLTMDPKDIENKITERTRAIIPVHMINLVANMDAIMKIAAAHDLFVIEDACQAIGLTYRGRRVGSIGHAGAFSFNQHKNIKSGEGGALLTNDERVHVRALMYHDVGSYIRTDGPGGLDEPLFVGVNFRMPEIAAAILRPQLKSLDSMLSKRQKHRQIALQELERLPQAGWSVSPHHGENAVANLTLKFDDPNKARAFATARGLNRMIDTGRHVYTNWLPILARRTAHPKSNPYRDRPNDEKLTERTCPRTLAILERTCSVSMLPEAPSLPYRFLMRRLLGQGMTAATAAAPQASSTTAPVGTAHAVE